MRFLHGLNPLALLGAVLPAVLVVLLSHDHLTPALALIAATALVLIGARQTRQVVLAVWVALPLTLLLATFGYALWTTQADRMSAGTLIALRLASLLALALLAGAALDGPELVRAAVRFLRLPYRVGYAALAALRFIPRYRQELATIRAAHRVRGLGGSGILAGVRREVGHLVPLLAGAIRHAERVALAMDARAFGAHPTRTERHPSVWRTRDTVWLGGGILAGIGLTISAVLT